jgi:hypothetical protein
MQFAEYKNFGKCVRFERGGIICLVTLEIGPRIIYYGTENLNFMNEDIGRNVQKDGEFFDKTYKAGEKWFLYGGHRVWKSPEDMETYVPDNYPVEYSLNQSGGEFYTQTTPFGLKFGFELIMDEGGALEIKNRIKNFGQPRQLAVWALTVVAKGGVLTVPLNQAESDLLPSQNFVLWPYCGFADERLSVAKGVMSLKQADGGAFKIGLFLKDNMASYELNGKKLRVCYQQPDGGADAHLDFGCNFETYTNEHILEIEGLSAKKTIGKNQTAEFCQRMEIL